jgi:pimeloyl-ACP methyl ester carboxylesterase
MSTRRACCDRPERRARKSAITLANFVLIHGAGDVGWYWHLLEAELRRLSHLSVAPDLPVEDDQAGLNEYADVLVESVRDTRDLVVVGQSLGGYVAPIVAAQLNAVLIVLVAGMVPSPGESAEEMFSNTGWQPDPSASDEMETFYHDVPPALARQAVARGRRQSDTPGREPWPMPAWPDIPTRFVLGRNDRFFTAPWLRGVVRDRLGIDADEIASGHCPALSRPIELAQLLGDYVADARARS